MIPESPLPYAGDFTSAEEYIEHLLHFIETTDIFQILCGGVHILDFFTTDPGLFHAALPEEWHAFLLSCDIMRLLDLLLKDDLDNLNFGDEIGPPQSLLDYIKSIRSLNLRRECPTETSKLPVLPRSVAVGMRPKKIHEVRHFIDYINRLSSDIQNVNGDEISHFVDFGSGQNYLGRALASEPYGKNVVAVEGRENNVTAARGLDILSGLAVKEKVMRNKKLWAQISAARDPNADRNDPEALANAIKQVAGADAFEFRPVGLLKTEKVLEEGKGQVQYVSGRLDSGDLSDVISKIERDSDDEEEGREVAAKLKLMAISIHSCGNLSHFGIRSLIMNPDIRAIAIVGCCYNLMTEKLGPPTYKHTYLRPTLQAVNGRVMRESAKYDPQGFPMSERFSTYKGDGVRLNITARMMACQSPANWTAEDSEGFFTRHFFRAVLQKMFLDRGVVSRIWHDKGAAAATEDVSQRPSGPFDMSTSPVIIGSLRKPCYASLKSYVRGVVEKLTTSSDFKQYADVMRERMAGITDEEIERYERDYEPRRKELKVIWTLMAFSATVVESLIVTDRWVYLKEQPDVESAWVDTVFDYKQSPRNLVVVGVKKRES